MTSLVVMIASGEIRAPENGCSEPSVTVTAPLVMHLPTLRLSNGALVWTQRVGPEIRSEDPHVPGSLVAQRETSVLLPSSAEDAVEVGRGRQHDQCRISICWGETGIVMPDVRPEDHAID